jgi:DNA-binding transcriptional regulator GbsR (MarR family)
VSELGNLRAAFVNLWGRMGPLWGIPPTAARVYGWLIASDEAADAETISGALELSRGGVSMARKELRDWGLIVVTRAPGSRRDLFGPEDDLERAMRNIVTWRKRREWEPMLHDLRDWIPQLEKEKSAAAATFRRRLTDLESMATLVDELTNQFLAGGTLQRIGMKAMLATAKLTGRRRRG